MFVLFSLPPCARHEPRLRVPRARAAAAPADQRRPLAAAPMDKRASTRRPLATALLSMASIAVTCAALELAARWAMRGPPGAPSWPRPSSPTPCAAGATGRGASGSYGARRGGAINRRGLRDVDREDAPPAGVERVLILGDPVRGGFSVPFDACVSQALERTLRKGGCAAEVALQRGTVGYSTDQEYLFYRRGAARYGARAVVLLVYHNDILYNARGAQCRAGWRSRSSPSPAARRG